MSQAISARLGALGDLLTLAVSATGAIGIQITGTFVGTISFEATLDGVIYVAVNLTPIDGTTEASSATAAGIWAGAIGGLGIFRARVSAYTSGAATVSLRNSPAGARSAASGGGGGGGAVTVADGADVTQGAIADVAVTGDNSGTVKAALRGLGKILADVWDSVNHRLNVYIQNTTLPITQAALTPNAPTVATVGTLSAQALAANASRTAVMLVNTSSNIIYLGLGATAVVGSGIALTPYSSFGPLPRFTGAINAIATGASSNLSIQEFQ